MEVDFGPLPTGWRWARVGDLSERVSVGYVSSTRDYFCPPGEGVPLIRSQNIRPGRLVLDDTAWVTHDFHRANPKSRLQPGDVLITRVGANAGDVCIVPDGIGEMHLSSAVFARPRRQHRKYMELFFRSPLGQYALKSRIVGSVSERINTRDVEALSVLLPPEPEEAAIADILGTLDDRIELTRRMNVTLEALARAHFKSWFVDFEPVRAKAAGRDPGLPQALADLLPDSFEDSELGQVPKGWRVGTIGAIASRVLDKVKNRADWAQLPLIDLSRMPQTSIALSDWGQGSELTTSVTRFLEKDTLFGAIRPYFHKVGVAPMNGVTNVSVFVVRARHASDWAFVAMLCSMTDTVGYATQMAKGTKMPVVSWADLRDYAFPTPPPEVRAAFGQVAGPTLERLCHGILASRTLASIRDALLPRLISGELRIDLGAHTATTPKA